MNAKKNAASNPSDGLKYWLECKHDNKKKDLLAKANNFIMVLIYLNDCLSNEMRGQSSKKVWNEELNKMMLYWD